MTFSEPSFLNSQRRSIFPSELGASSTLTRLANAATRPLGASLLTTIVVNPAHSSLATFASAGVRARASSTMRRST